MTTMEPPRAAPFDPTRLPAAGVFADLEALHAEVTALFGRITALRSEADRAEARLADLRRLCRVAMAGGQEPPRALVLAQRREALGLSQYQLAAASGYSRNMVAAVEKGQRTGWDARAALDRALTRLERERAGGVA